MSPPRTLLVALLTLLAALSQGAGAPQPGITVGLEDVPAFLFADRAARLRLRADLPRADDVVCVRLAGEGLVADPAVGCIVGGLDGDGVSFSLTAADDCSAHGALLRFEPVTYTGEEPPALPEDLLLELHSADRRLEALLDAEISLAPSVSGLVRGLPGPAMELSLSYEGNDTDAVVEVELESNGTLHVWPSSVLQLDGSNDSAWFNLTGYAAGTHTLALTAFVDDAVVANLTLAVEVFDVAFPTVPTLEAGALSAALSVSFAAACGESITVTPRATGVLAAPSAVVIAPPDVAGSFQLLGVLAASERTVEFDVASSAHALVAAHSQTFAVEAAPEDDDDDGGGSTAAAGTMVTTVAATLTLGGVTAADFDDDAQWIFRVGLVATIVGLGGDVGMDDVAITSFADTAAARRRLLAGGLAVETAVSASGGSSAAATAAGEAVAAAVNDAGFAAALGSALDAAGLPVDDIVAEAAAPTTPVTHPDLDSDSASAGGGDDDSDAVFMGFSVMGVIAIGGGFGVLLIAGVATMIGDSRAAEKKAKNKVYVVKASPSSSSRRNSAAPKDGQESEAAEKEKGGGAKTQLDAEAERKQAEESEARRQALAKKPPPTAWDAQPKKKLLAKKAATKKAQKRVQKALGIDRPIV